MGKTESLDTQDAGDCKPSFWLDWSDWFWVRVFFLTKWKFFKHLLFQL